MTGDLLEQDGGPSKTGGTGAVSNPPCSYPRRIPRALRDVVLIDNTPLERSAAADFVRRTVTCKRAAADILDALGLEV